MHLSSSRHQRAELSGSFGANEYGRANPTSRTDPSCARLAAGALRPRRAGAAGRRRARRLSGRRLSGLHEAGIEPDWVSGVSIGAINAALIAGNPPERRVERLREFWDRITSRTIWHYTPDGDIYRQTRNSRARAMTTTLGQPGFFKPHKINPWLCAPVPGPRPAITTPSRCARHCIELVDFELHQRHADAALRSARSMC